jgi:Ring hydroxylating beta subunit
MSIVLENRRAETAALSVEDVRQFVYREARFLDDKEWENCLALYAPDVEYWMPSWDDDDQLVADPQTQISLIWYGHKGGLEDRVFRIRTERSTATSMPEPQDIAQYQQCRNTRAGRRRLRAALQLGDIQLSLQDGGHLFRHLLLHARHHRCAAADQAEEGDPEERLHPPCGRHLPRLRAWPEMNKEFRWLFVIPAKAGIQGFQNLTGCPGPPLSRG